MAHSRSHLSHFKLRQILGLYRICFEAAVKAYRSHSVTTFRGNPDDQRRWDVYPDLETEGGLPIDADAKLVAAYKKWNLCEHFCCLLYAAVNRHLGKYGAEVYWVRFDVVPTFFLEYEGELLKPFGHAVLFVQIPVGESFIFDCTGEQFDWPISDWLTIDIARHLVDVEATWGDGAATLPEVREGIFKDDNGYWKRAFRSFNNMWEKIRWDRMEKEEFAEAERLVRETAEKRAEAAAFQTWG